MYSSLYIPRLMLIDKTRDLCCRYSDPILLDSPALLENDSSMLGT